MLSQAGVASAQSQYKMSGLHGPNWQYFSTLNEAGFLLLDQHKQPLESKNSQQFYVPASTTKLITAFLALKHWGEDYRFKTEFYLTERVEDSAVLVVKGYGDPFLVSEEFPLLVEGLKTQLQAKGIHHIKAIQLDSSFYQPGLIMPGTGESDNPYDAIPAAIAANFNSIFVKKQGSELLSAEPQTPMTPAGLQIAKTITVFKKTKEGLVQRINLGNDATLNQRYFSELLRWFMEQQGLDVENQVLLKALPKTQDNGANHPVLLYTHFNSRTLAEVIKPMMKYSTNFIANQLALNLSAELLGGEATQQKVALVYKRLLTEYFGWQTFHIEDGAGLSRNNRLAPSQLVDVLQAFRPWAKLLPEIEQSVFAKSGSLIGVSTLAGYLKNEQGLLPFAMMINQKVPYRFRNKLAKELAQAY
ncbi:peptidase S13 [Thiomicrorhabdus immobilis]|uniref:Peptidase S13 n=1 Tax=Thiomicrorhabdus immobilis TaxID=2791037 RepID=A0ABN6CXL9_9GAMM|nr:peptidase S13 [Thiomicrorhabdus immobilis]